MYSPTSLADTDSTGQSHPQAEKCAGFSPITDAHCP